MERKNTVLIADDEAIFAMDLQLQLQQMGYNVFKPVGKGESAVQAAEKEKPDYILLDIRLAGKLGGIQVAEKVRRFSNSPIVFMTGYYANEGLEEKLAEISNSAVLYKPFSPVKLGEVLERFQIRK